MDMKIPFVTVLLALMFPCLALANYTISGNAVGQCNSAGVSGAYLTTTNESGTALTNITSGDGEYTFCCWDNASVGTITHNADGFSAGSTGVTVAGDTVQNLTLDDYCPTYGASDVGPALFDLGTGLIVVLISLASLIGLLFGIRYLQGKPMIPKVR